MMNKYLVKEVHDKKVWEDFLLGRKVESFLQSWNWGETNRVTGHKIYRLGFYALDKLVGVCLLIKEEAKRGPHFLVPAGPVLDWENKELVNIFVKTVKDIGSREKIWFVRVRPEMHESEEARRLFSSLGFVASPMHLHAENTWVLDITLSEEALLKNMRKSTRYLIKKSLDMHLVLEKTVDPSQSTILKELQDETAGRHRFVGFAESLFKAQLTTFGEDKQAVLFICRRDKIVLAAAIIVFYGDFAYYNHSGSSSRFMEIPSSYFLQWHIIQEAKRRGCKYYNFWGIASTDDPKHRFAGVTLFKKGFGGERIDWMHAHDLPLTPFYWLTYGFETLRRKLRRL